MIGPALHALGWHMPLVALHFAPASCRTLHGHAARRQRSTCAAPWLACLGGAQVARSPASRASRPRAYVEPPVEALQPIEQPLGDVHLRLILVAEPSLIIDLDSVRQDALEHWHRRVPVSLFSVKTGRMTSTSSAGFSVAVSRLPRLGRCGSRTTPATTDPRRLAKGVERYE